MTVCTYDNPATWRRECWQDGVQIVSLSCDLLRPYDKENLLGGRFPFTANVGKWEPGKVHIGSLEAMTPTPPITIESEI